MYTCVRLLDRSHHHGCLLKGDIVVPPCMPNNGPVAIVPGPQAVEAGVVSTRKGAAIPPGSSHLNSNISRIILLVVIVTSREALPSVVLQLIS